MNDDKLFQIGDVVIFVLNNTLKRGTINEYFEEKQAYLVECEKNVYIVNRHRVAPDEEGILNHYERVFTGGLACRIKDNKLTYFILTEEEYLYDIDYCSAVSIKDSSVIHGYMPGNTYYDPNIHQFKVLAFYKNNVYVKSCHGIHLLDVKESIYTCMSETLVEPTVEPEDKEKDMSSNRKFNVGDYVFFISNNEFCRGKILDYLPVCGLYSIEDYDTTVLREPHTIMSSNCTVHTGYCHTPRVGDLVCKIDNNELVYFVAQECDLKRNDIKICLCVSLKDSSAKHVLKVGDWFERGRVVAFYNNTIYIRTGDGIINLQYDGVEDEQKNSPDKEVETTDFNILSLDLEIVAFNNFDGKVKIVVEDENATFNFSSSIDIMLDDFHSVVKELKKFTQKNFPEVKYYYLKM